MKFIASKQDLLNTFQMLQPAVAQRPTLPILANIFIKAEKAGLLLRATNLSLFVSYPLPVKVEAEGECTFHAKRLLDVTRELPENDVDFEADNGNIGIIRSGSAKYKLYGITADDFPPDPKFDKTISFTIEQAVARDIFAKTVYAAAIEETRPILNGVMMSLKDQKLTAVATDGRRMALVEQDLETPIETAMDIIIPLHSVNEILKILGDKGTVRVEACSKYISFDTGSGGIRIISNLVEGTYPNYRQVIPSQTAQRIAVERELFLASIQRVMAIRDKNPGVKLTFQKNKIFFTTVQDNVGEASEELTVKYSGPEMAITFNADLLMDPLRNLTCDEIFFEINDSMTPSMIKCSLPFLYVIMPLRLS